MTGLMVKFSVNWLCQQEPWILNTQHENQQGRGFAHRACCRLKHDNLCFTMKLESCYDVMSFNLSPVNSAWSKMISWMYKTAFFLQKQWTLRAQRFINVFTLSRVRFETGIVWVYVFYNIDNDYLQRRELLDKCLLFPLNLCTHVQ